MPKKFQGENSKAATARARKAEAKAVADARKKQEEEDALWQETDKHVLKKEQRKVCCFFTWCFVYVSDCVLVLPQTLTRTQAGSVVAIHCLTLVVADSLLVFY